jgi:CcmD family protein
MTDTTRVDTLTTSYSEKWQGVDPSTNNVIDFMASNELIFVVLGVTLIIWFVLLVYMIRLDRTLSKLERDLKEVHHHDVNLKDAKTP